MSTAISLYGEPVNNILFVLTIPKDRFEVHFLALKRCNRLIVMSMLKPHPILEAIEFVRIQFEAIEGGRERLGNCRCQI